MEPHHRRWAKKLYRSPENKKKEKMVSRNHILKCCILLLAMLMIVQAQTNRKLLDTYFNPPSMESRQASLPSSHRSLGAEFYERSPPPPPPKKTKKDESETGIWNHWEMSIGLGEKTRKIGLFFCFGNGIVLMLVFMFLRDMQCFKAWVGFI